MFVIPTLFYLKNNQDPFYFMALGRCETFPKGSGLKELNSLVPSGQWSVPGGLVLLCWGTGSTG